MATILGPRGFEIKRCTDGEATREGIIHAWRQLISESADGDVGVVYYSGHGGKVEMEKTTSEAGQPWRFQFLVPTDFDKTTDADFRGIADVELSHMQRPR
jgi:hypothetical protein